MSWLLFRFNCAGVGSSESSAFLVRCLLEVYLVWILFSLGNCIQVKRSQSLTKVNIGRLLAIFKMMPLVDFPSPSLSRDIRNLPTPGRQRCLGLVAAYRTRAEAVNLTADNQVAALRILGEGSSYISWLAHLGGSATSAYVYGEPDAEQSPRCMSPGLGVVSTSGDSLTHVGSAYIPGATSPDSASPFRPVNNLPRSPVAVDTSRISHSSSPSRSRAIPAGSADCDAGALVNVRDRGEQIGSTMTLGRGVASLPVSYVRQSKICWAPVKNFLSDDRK